MTPAALDGVRVTSVARRGDALRIDADISAAYPAELGLQRFARALTIERERFLVEDVVMLSTAKPVEWYFHSDRPITGSGDGYMLGGNPGLRLTVETGVVEATIGPTILMAPGQPGSITKGVEESRGFHVKLQSKPVTNIQLKTVLTLTPQAGTRRD